MAKAVLKWPLEIAANGVLKQDTSHQSGMRLFACTPRKTRLGQPGIGINTALMEQIPLVVNEDMMLLLSALMIDMANFIPVASILEINAKKVPGQKRVLDITVRYLSKNTIAKQFSFQWRMGL